MKITGRMVWICLACFTLIGVTFAAQFYFYLHSFGQQITWSHALKWMLGSWYLWGMMCPVIFRGAARFAPTRGRWGPAVAAHVAIGIATAIVHIVLYATWTWFAAPIKFGPPGWAGSVKYQLTSGLSFDIFCYAAIVTAYYAFDNARKYREGQVRASQLETQLARAQLEALRMQLHPHFLFNTLNAIAGMIRDDPRGAEGMVTRLSELLRMALDKSDVQLIPLREELDFARKYLDIQSVRFGDRLEVAISAAAETREVPVPTFILQPVIENAVRHGLSSEEKICRVRIDASVADGMLAIVVSDSGPGVDMQGEGVREGIGLSNTRARIRQMYGERAQFELANGKVGGCTASIRIPIESEGAYSSTGAQA
jgi:hypothetical protein